MIIMENNAEPFMENGEPILSRKRIDTNREPFSKNGLPNFFCRSLEING